MEQIQRRFNNIMINAKITKQATQQTTEEKLFKLLESIDWKLWEMMNMMKEINISWELLILVLLIN